jgi:hypothetical protein
MPLTLMSCSLQPIPRTPLPLENDTSNARPVHHENRTPILRFRHITKQNLTNSPRHIHQREHRCPRWTSVIRTIVEIDSEYKSFGLV